MHPTHQLRPTIRNLAQKSSAPRADINTWTQQYAPCAERYKALFHAAGELIDNSAFLSKGLDVAKILSTFGKNDNLLIAALVNVCKTYKEDGITATQCRELISSNLTKNIQIILLKLAIQLHTMQISINADESTKLSLAQQAQELYIPLAKSLNIGQVAWQLEDLVFKFLHPGIYKKIATLLDERRIEREEYILDVKQQLEECLQLRGIRGEVFGRAKHIYSIWRKMQRKMLDYNAIYDVHALRIIVPDVGTCYAALRAVHTLWQHLPKEFDDYISNPKDNGYKSLHTKVLGPNGKILEVQFRTIQMHKQAESGVAAHWRYKMATHE